MFQILALLIGGYVMSDDRPNSPERTGAEALSHLEEALTLLDEIDAPGEIGAYVDMAIHRLRAALLLIPIEGKPPEPDE